MTIVDVMILPLYANASLFLIIMKGVLMLHTCGRVVLEKLANAKGKIVEYIDLFDLPSCSLIRLTTESGNSYIIETLDKRDWTGIQVNIARMQTNLVMASRISHRTVKTHEPLTYVSKHQTFSTSPIKEIHLLVLAV